MKRRVKDDGSPRVLRLTPTQRELVALTVEETHKHAEERAMKALGISPEMHAADHSFLNEMKPFLKAMESKWRAEQDAADERAKLYRTIREKLLTEGVIHAVRWSLYIAFMILALGISGAWNVLISGIKRFLES